MSEPIHGCASSTLTLDDVLHQQHSAHQEVVNVDEPHTQLVFFALGDVHFAFPGRHVQEILAGTDTPVHFIPGCPPSLEGVINVRGDIESVIGLQQLLQLPANPTPIASSSAIVLARSVGLRSGLRVDRIVDVVDVPQSHLQPPPANVAEHLRPLVLGVLQWQSQPVTLLDVERLLGDYAQTLA